MARCTATSKRTAEQCKKQAVPGSNVCRMHGYNPDPSRSSHPGNTHAMKSGRRETILWSTLTDAERAAWGEISTDPEAQLITEIRLTEIREARMMQRIADLAGVDFTEVERAHQKGLTAEGMIDVLATKSLATLGQIQAIEDDLTKVQHRKEKLIALAFAKLVAAEDGALADLVASIERARAARSR